MGDSEKPFACPSPGCNMSFTNEDHLVVHRKKHDMVLNLGNNGKNTFVADQTPTPTRFIRNCEEVGLFQDLQNVNPFEETFRRAVEDGKIVALTESEGASADDTLHTPHIFPGIADASAETSVPEKPQESTEERATVVEINRSIERTVGTAATEGPEATIADSKGASRSVAPMGGIVVRGARNLVASKTIEGSKSATNLSINGQEVQLLLKTADGKLVQLSAVPVCENRAIDEPRIVCLKDEGNTVEAKKIANSENKMTIAKMRLKQALTKNVTSSDPIASKNFPENPTKSRTARSVEKTFSSTEQRRKLDVLARNRASSMRARAKRKAWIQQLQKAASSANERNATLQHEVKALRCEVAKLRALLLAHESCPVTRAMEKGTPIAVQESKSVTPAIRTLVQNVNASASSVLSRRRAVIETRTGNHTAETPIAPKIPKLLASGGNAIILPKPTETIVPQGGYVIRDLSALRIVDVRKIGSETDISMSSSPRRIVLVDNPSINGNINARIRHESATTVATTIAIRTNPTMLQIENAASKCTGT